MKLRTEVNTKFPKCQESLQTLPRKEAKETIGLSRDGKVTFDINDLKGAKLRSGPEESLMHPAGSLNEHIRRKRR